MFVIKAICSLGPTPTTQRARGVAGFLLERIH
jgi:hypothetical protein